MFNKIMEDAERFDRDCFEGARDYDDEVLGEIETEEDEDGEEEWDDDDED